MNKKTVYATPLKRLSLAASVSLGVVFPSVADVNVKIKITEPEHHLANVSIALPVVEQDKVIVQLPTWRTGRYEILNLAGGIRLFEAKTADGKTLSWKKIDKSRWQIDNPSQQAVTVSYQVYANELGFRTRHIDDSHAFLDASAVVMYAPECRDDKHIVSLQVPEKWQSFSGLAYGDHKQQFIADNYDVLVDSPIETGVQTVRNFTVDSRDYQLVIWGEGNYNVEQMVKDLTVLVKQGSQIWHDYPFSRYVFMVHATSGARGATEHLNSTIIQRSRYKFHDREDYLGFLSTAAHEFVHTWNVKQYRPEGLAPYDYQQENYTNLLWVSEGSTSYLQTQLLMRGELMSSTEYLKEIAKRITAFNHKPGKNFQTVSESSFNHWLEQGGDYGNNYEVNIYSEGFMASWMLDLKILAESDGKLSYRDVHHQLYKEYKLPHAFTEQDMQEVLADVTGNDYSTWWQQHAHGYLAPDFDKMLASVGLQMQYGKGNKQQAFAGIKTKKDDSGVVITRVEKDSPAWLAGLTTDDIVVAVNGLRLQTADINARLKDFEPGDKVSISYFRRDKLHSAEMTLANEPKEKLKIVAIEGASDKQKALFKAWTGLNFPEK